MLAREQHLSQLDGLAAAAAHELGTPLATIALVAKELDLQLPPDSPLAGDVALLWTDWSRFYAAGPKGRRYVHGPLVTKSSPGWPALDPEAAIFLCERGVVTVGTDAPSMGAAQGGAPVHREGLSRGMLFIELLTNLGRLPPRGALFIFLPLKIAASTGGPGRAIALLGQTDPPQP